MRRKKRIFIFLLSVALCVVCNQTAFSQGKSTGKESEGADVSDSAKTQGEVSDSKAKIEEGEVEPLYQSTLKLDIESANYYELYYWCKRLGLDTTGDFKALRQKLFQYYKIQIEAETKIDEQGAGSVKPAPKTIIIKSASDSEYFKVEEVNEKYLLLKGDVFVEVIDKNEDVIHRIRANRIILNQTQNIITAQENVEYQIIRGVSKPEIFRGESFSFSLQSWDGVFYRGRGETAGEVKEGESVEFTFYGETISRLSNDTVILENGGVTSSKEKNDPFWQIKASKIMVLAPGEWTISNAALCIGRIPVLYIPFFFYPGDELFFSPVIGYRDREGNFVQTTTYLIGKKDKKKSPFSFLRATEDTQEGGTELRGLFLSHVKKGKEETKNKDWILKMMIDLYSRLGGFTGIAMNFPPAFKLNAGVGVSRNVYSEGVNRYTVVSPDDDLEHWNTISIFGLPIPLRYGLDSSFNIGLFENNLTLSGNMEIYSDPYFPLDFYDRKEDMDFSKLLGLSQDEIKPPQAAERTQYTWSVKSALNLSRFMPTPFIKSLNINYLNLDLSWLSMADLSLSSNGDADAAVDPFRTFYFPDRLILPNLKVSLEGDILNFSTGAATMQPGDKNVQPDPGAGFRIPSDLVTGEEQKPAETTEIPPDLVVPQIKENEGGIQFRPRISSYTLGYVLAPLVQIENQFDKAKWTSIDTLDYSMQYSTFLSQVPLSLKSALALDGDLFRMQNTITLDQSFKTKFNRGSSVTDETWDTLLNADYSGTYLKLGTTSALSLKPLIDVYGFKDSVLNYRLNWLLYEYVSYSPPVYETRTFQWDKKAVTLHGFDTRLQYSVDKFPASIYLESTFPPVDPRIYSTLEFYTWLWKTRGEVTLKPDTRDSSIFRFTPGSVSETIELAPYFSFSELYKFDNYTYDTNSNLIENHVLLTSLKLWKYDGARYFAEEELEYDLVSAGPKKFRSSLSFYAFDAVFLAEKVFPVTSYDGIQGVLVFGNTLRFLPNTFSLNFKSKLFDFTFWKQRIFMDLTVDTRLTYNFQRFTDSTFNFLLTVNLEIAEFLTLMFSSESYNNNIYRYIPGVPEIVGYTLLNPFSDLAQSFNFFNTTDREESNFKIKSLKVSVIHKLYDWDLAFEFTGTFQKVTELNNYVFWPSFSISVKWHDIPEIKKDMKGDYDNPLNIWT